MYLITWNYGFLCCNENSSGLTKTFVSCNSMIDILVQLVGGKLSGPPLTWSILYQIGAAAHLEGCVSIR
jgi:hypothetical protein